MVNSFVVFSSDGEFVSNWYLIQSVSENKRDFELFNHGKAFFKNLYIADVVDLISQEADCLTKQNNSCHVRSRRKAKSNAKSLDRSMALSWIFLNNDG